MRRHTGFTLIELMVVVAILGIIAAVAIPSYDAYIIRSKRSDGMAALMNASNAMSRYRAVNRNYLNANANVPFVQDYPANNPYYRITVGNINATGTTYTLTATPVGSMAGKDGALTITQAGVKTWSDKSGTLHNCWPESSSTC